MKLKAGMWLRCHLEGHNQCEKDKWYRVTDVLNSYAFAVDVNNAPGVFTPESNPFDLDNPAYGAPFGLQQALAGAKLVTRDGRTVTDFTESCTASYPYVATVWSLNGGHNATLRYNGNGVRTASTAEPQYDLLIAEYANDLLKPVVGRFVRCVANMSVANRHFTPEFWYNVLSYADNHYKLLGNIGETYEFTAASPFFDWSNPKTADELGSEPLPAAQPSILQEAERLINGDREADYGSVATNFNRIAAGWSQIFGTTVTPEQVGLAMAWLKIARQIHKPKRDNLVDAAGYLGLVEKLNK